MRSPRPATLRADQAVAPPGPVRRTPSALAGGLLATARPRQWIKNVLVFAAPGAAGVLLDPPTLVRALLAFVVFTLAAAGTYYVNDALDHVADRLHPRKRHRPVAAGVVPVPLARVVGGLLLGAAIALALPLGGWPLTLTIAVYGTLMLAYSLWLKHVPVIDLGVVASGFVLRAVAGGIAADVPLSSWFVIVASFASLFIVAGKRYAEVVALGADAGAHRATLDGYSPAFLGYVCAIASAVAIVAYCLWALTQVAGGNLWYQLSIIPFVLGILSYALEVESGDAGAPEEVILGHRTLQVLGLAWAALFAAGVYGG